MSHPPRDLSGPGAGIYLAFAPWVLFTLIAQHSTLELATIAAVVVSAASAVPGLLRRSPKLLEVGAVVTFAAFAVVAFTADHAAGVWVARYARAIAAALLTLIALGSLAFVPFTEQYARQSVPRELWSSTRFRQSNRLLTRRWAMVFALMVPAHVIAGAIDTHRANLIFNWAIPIVLIVWAVKRTAGVTATAREPVRSRDDAR